MQFIQSIFDRYKNVERPIRYIIAAQFCVQGMNTAFFILLNYFMSKEGFKDFEIANVLSYRFLAVFCLAFPVGLYIKGKKLKPFFYASTIGSPIMANLLILAIYNHWPIHWVNGLAMLWGLSYTFMQITILPFILLNAQKENHSEAISLSFLSFAVTSFFIGFSYFILNGINPDFFDERLVLQVIASISIIGVYFVYKGDLKEQLSEPVPLSKIWKGYDWWLILKVESATTLIAIGAGFTIPVINLFFLNVHGISSEQFSAMGSVTFFLVACVMFLMPFIRRSFGYSIAITLFQSLAIFALFMLATTEWYKDWTYAAGIAIFFYVIRQPLMSAAGPMTSELTMYYVGQRNREIIAALNASIWSGSWFVSTSLFSLLRQMEYSYASIFLITVGFYIAGVSWYAYLIYSYKQRTGSSGKEKDQRLQVARSRA